MCGIAGVLSWDRNPDPALVAAMTESIAHRGPDGHGLVCDGPVCFGHRRLAIIDLSPGGAQPKRDHEDQTLITFNGEIYNYRELRRELEERGARFTSESDTEVILEAYKAWGPKALSRLNGMFAFALWDKHKKRLLLARDRLGEKPLYWRQTPDGLQFGSELKTVRMDPSLSDEIDRSALCSFLTLGYICGEQSIICGINRLPAGAYLVAEPGKSIEIHRYWDLAGIASANIDKPPSFSDAAEELQSLIDDATRLRLVADVPVGAFLSGGIDSAAIVAAMRKVRPDAETHTFSVGFTERGFDEIEAARESAQYLNSIHTDARVDAHLAQTLPDLVRYADEPFADTSLLPTYELSRFARRRTTVVLSGDGGDELFAGYVTYRANVLRRRMARLPTPLIGAARALLAAIPSDHGKVSWNYKGRQFLDHCQLPFERAHFSWRQFLPDEIVGALLAGNSAPVTHPFAAFERAFDDVRHWDEQRRAAYVDVKTWMVDDILVKVDRASMAHALEVRPPFLDHRLVEFAFKLPSHYSIKGNRQKRILKASQKDRLPPSVLQRRKAGFNAPVSRWFQSEIQDHFERAVLHGPAANVIDPDVARAVRDTHLARTRDYGMPLLALTVLGLWLEAGRPKPSDYTTAEAGRPVAGDVSR